METLRHPMAAAAVLLFLGTFFSASKAIASESFGQKIERVAHKTGKGLHKGAAWTENGIKKGAQKTGEAIAKVGNKLQHSAE